MSDIQTSQTMPEPTQDARALLARLYREIGISAVSAALELNDLPVETQKLNAERASREVSAILRGETIAA